MFAWLIPISAVAELRSTTQEQRRDAIEKHQLNPWLSLGFQIELQQQYESENSTHGSVEAEGGLNIEFEAVPREWLEIEASFEITNESGVDPVDELFANLVFSEFEFSYGRQALPFGEFISHLPSASEVEFGEIKDTVGILGYAPSESLSLEVFAAENSALENLDWGRLLPTSLKPHFLLD